MHFWLVTVGEPLPTDEGSARLLRAGLLFQTLLDRDHEVRWWTSGWDHQRKIARTDRLLHQEISPAGTITLLPSIPYMKNVSVRRLIHHEQVARGFRKAGSASTPPDLILASYPTIELSREAVRMGRRVGIPVVLDVRDLWPDQIWDSLLPPMRMPRTLALWPLRRQARKAIRGATAITGVTEEFVDWALSFGGRKRGRLDRAFPMAYPPAANGGISAEALGFWKERGITEDQWTVCFFGALGRQFELEPVFQAAETLAERIPTVRFVICGSGDRLEHYRRRAEGLPNMLLPGWVEAPQIRALMSVAKAGLAPYPPDPNYTLNLPNKPVEYFAGGLPVLYSIDGVLDRICTRESCGMRYSPSPDDTNSLAAVIAELHDSETVRSSMAANARRLFQERYRADEVYPRMAAYLELMVLDHGAPSRRTP